VRFPTSTSVYNLTPSPLPIASPTLSDTPLPSPTIAPSPTPNTEIEGTYAGDPLPTNLSVISVDNLAELELLSRWGKGTVESVMHSPDGKLIAVASSRGAYLYDAFTLEYIRLIPTKEWTYDVAFSPDGKLLSLQTACGTEMYDLETGSMLWSTHFEYCRDDGSIAISPDGKIVASGLDSEIQLRDALHGGLLKQLETSKGIDERDYTEEKTSVLDLQFSPDGSILIVFQDDPAVDLFDVYSGKNLLNLSDLNIGSNLFDGEYYPGSVWAFISSEGKFLVVLGESSHWLSFFELPTGTLAHTLDYPEKNDGSMISMAISPLGDKFALGRNTSTFNGENFIEIRNLEDGTLINTLVGHDGEVTSLSFSSDEQRLVSGAIDNTLRLWRIEDGALLGVVHEHTDEIHDLDFSPDSHLLAVAMKDRKARVWQIPSGKLVFKLGATSDFGYPYERYVPGMYSLDFSPDGSILATGSDRLERVQLWDISTGAVLKQLGYDHVFQLDFASDDALIVQFGFTGRGEAWGISLLNLINEKSVLAPDSSGGEHELILSPNGNLIAASYTNYENYLQWTYWIDVWAISGVNFMDKWTLIEGEDYPISMVFSSNEEMMALAYQKKGCDYEEQVPKLQIIDSRDGSLKSEFILNNDEFGDPLGMAFSASGEMLGVIRSQGFIQFFTVPDLVPIRIVNIQTSTSPVLYRHYFDSIGILRFSPDDKLLALVLSDGSVELWGVVQ